jgi:hypothetical protein
MDSARTRVALYDIYPDIENMKYPLPFEDTVASSPTNTDVRINWGLIIFIAAAGVGVFYAVKWWEEEKNPRF